jgi:hypothetical protein
MTLKNRNAKDIREMSESGITPPRALRRFQRDPWKPKLLQKLDAVAWIAMIRVDGLNAVNGGYLKHQQRIAAFRHGL